MTKNELSVIENTIALPAMKNVNQAAVAKVTEKLPELTKKIRVFDRNNSQTTISLMSLTMLNGQSPMRIMRQILAEVDKRKAALAESQVSHAKLVQEIEELTEKYEANPTPVTAAELRLKTMNLTELEGKINGSLKDIATLITAYENMEEKHNLDAWDEETFEADEKWHHCRRGFELLYRNLVQNGRAHESSIEYLQQFGVHIQIALAEVQGYIAVTEKRIADGDHTISASDLEDFLDKMADKYHHLADEASERLFGKKDFTNKDFMLKFEKIEDEDETS